MTFRSRYLILLFALLIPVSLLSADKVTIKKQKTKTVQLKKITLITQGLGTTEAIPQSYTTASEAARNQISNAILRATSKTRYTKSGSSWKWENRSQVVESGKIEFKQLRPFFVEAELKLPVPRQLNGKKANRFETEFRFSANPKKDSLKKLRPIVRTINQKSEAEFLSHIEKKYSPREYIEFSYLNTTIKWKKKKAIVRTEYIVSGYR